MIGLELQRALDAFQLDAWLDSLGFTAHVNGERLGDCPRCGKEKLTVNVGKRYWHCWVCQKTTPVRQPDGSMRDVTTEGGGGVLRLVSWLYQISMGESAHWLIKVSHPVPLAAADLPALEAAAFVVDSTNVGDLVPPPCPPGTVASLRGTVPYLAGRGITSEMVQAYGLQLITSGGYAGRVVFPVWGGGQMLYWQARATWAPEADEHRGRRHVKSLNPARKPGQLTSEHVVFNLERAAKVGRGSIALCEGPIDAMKAGDDAVALFGKRLYPAQLRSILSAQVHTVQIMLDSDALSDAHQAAKTLSLFVRTRVVRLPSGDPGDFDRPTNAMFRAVAAGQPRQLPKVMYL